MDGMNLEKIGPAPLMTADEVVQVLRVTERTLWSWTAPRGPIPVIRIGRSVRYYSDAIQQFIASRVQTIGSKA